MPTLKNQADCSAPFFSNSSETVRNELPLGIRTHMGDVKGPVAIKKDLAVRPIPPAKSISTTNKEIIFDAALRHILDLRQ